jgi:predicted nucleic acid-binding protein
MVLHLLVKKKNRWLASNIRSLSVACARGPLSRILPIDVPVADRWSLLAATAKREGKTLSTIDGLLAATALHHNLTVVSRNVGDFAGTRVQVLNPWRA